MKYIQIQEGGHPFANDDLTFLQTSLQEGILGLAKMYGSNCILWGFNRFETTIEVEGIGPVAAYGFTPGWLVVNNKLVRFSGETYTFAASYNDYYVSTTPDGTIADQVMYADSTLKTIYWDEYASLTTSGSILLSEIEKRRIGPTDWRTVGGLGQPAFEAGWSQLTSPTIPLRFRHMHGCVEFSGGAQRATSIGTTASQIMTLPVECRPAYSYVQSISISDGTDRNNAVVIVDTNGAVYVRADTGSSLTAAIVRLDGIRIPLT